MDALKALASQQGCSTDGTAAQRNPMSQFVHQAMSGPQKQGPMPGQMHHGHAGPQQMNEVDQGMAQGMGVMAGPRGPVMAGPGTANSFAAEFEQMRATGAGPGGPVMRGPMARGPVPGGDQWINDFERMQLGGAMPPRNVQMEAAFRESFRRQQGPRPMGQRWAGQMAARPPPSQMNRAWQQTATPPPAAQQWAQEMAGPKEAPNAEKWVEEATAKEETMNATNPDMEATRRATDDLVRVMASNPQFRDSEFLQFMTKINEGELEFANNTVVETGVKVCLAPKNLDGAWKESGEKLDAAWEEGAPVESMGQAWEAAAMDKMQEKFAKAWQDTTDGKEVDFAQVYQDAIEEATGGMPPELAQAWQAQGTAMDQAWSDTQTSNLADRPYEMLGDNKFANEENPYERGLELFKAGEIQDAILAFEAAVTKDTTHADAWRMLGVAHQENDQDPKAIACLERAVDNDAYHLDALLGLGVSYVNELDQERALKNLKAWVVNNPAFGGLEVESEDLYGDGSLMDDVMRLMLKAQEWAPQDPGVQEVLGVLYNVSRDYNSAVLAFKKALNSRPDDYGLWNKLGATLANGQRSEEALPAYHRALELKPKYARGWLNLGISHSNLGSYMEAARCYLTALKLNPDATHIWSYLRICFTVAERFDLIAATDKRNLDAFRQEFSF
ncbi:Peroxisomal targeting signal 1 receptor [Hondaea fermentalgiana]|uniref:Peroxisomal targeting signal 1 receptor n=1 Tax=Hondaea fermentalgiana TaxID=2315210 RepID=A0A2R5G6P9_9STRA|nr:Peroxisomal targeting signal 1 receptor [Hondaea fermentalgiana]|eukprot:GBG26205.1 Peroxisomal targeting signal 1 receptor [Hondaea fermentalgiana]